MAFTGPLGLAYLNGGFLDLDCLDVTFSELELVPGLRWMDWV